MRHESWLMPRKLGSIRVNLVHCVVLVKKLRLLRICVALSSYWNFRSCPFPFRSLSWPSSSEKFSKIDVLAPVPVPVLEVLVLRRPMKIQKLPSSDVLVPVLFIVLEVLRTVPSRGLLLTTVFNSDLYSIRSRRSSIYLPIVFRLIIFFSNFRSCGLKPFSQSNWFNHFCPFWTILTTREFNR